MLGVLGVATFRLFVCVLVAVWRPGDSARYYSRSGTPRNIVRGVELREILFAEWDSAKYYSRSETSRNIPLGVDLVVCVSRCDWLSPWRAGCRVIGQLGGRHVWGLLAMSVEGCYSCGKMGHVRGKCSTSILGALTVLIIGTPDGLLGKEVEGMCPRIVPQVTQVRARKETPMYTPEGAFHFSVF